MPTTEYPTDLIDKLTDGLHDAMYGDSGTPSSLREVRLIFAPAVLAALAEWADGALIDPSTWTRVRAEEVFVPEATDLPLHMLTREDP